MHPNPTTSRRAFIGLSASIVAGLMAAPASALGRLRRRPEHPEPRPGINARNVTPRDQLPEDLVPVFDRAREIPHVLDGIACQCGCAEMEDIRSLLSCFEGYGMAQHCIYCQGQADLAYEMTAAGRSLDQIRLAVEAEFA